MNKDHLDNKIGISGSLTTNGENPLDIKGGVKVQSRFLSSIDRLGGCIPDILSAFLEGKSRIIRAKNDAKVALIEAIGKKNVAKLENDDHFAFKAINNSIDKSFARQEKIDLVCAEALTDLTDNPPTEDETDCDQDKLSEAFLNRLGNHVENATEEEIKAKWARILASEIKKPNTFSPKTMRIVDELDTDAANLFEELCNFRLGGRILKHQSGELIASKKGILTTAGLIIDSPFGHTQPFVEAVMGKDKNVLLAQFGEFAICILNKPNIVNDTIVSDAPITFSSEESKYSIPVYVLTPEGEAIASILQDKQKETMDKYVEVLSNYMKDISVAEFKLDDTNYVPLCAWRNGAPIENIIKM